MTDREAVEIIRCQRPTSGYTMLCQALDRACEALTERNKNDDAGEAGYGEEDGLSKR